jgi:hypothetical protein
MNFVRVAITFGAWLVSLAAVVALAHEGHAWPFA